MPVLYNNNAITSLNGAITNVATSITVLAGGVFPAVSTPDYIYLTITEGVKIEIIKVTDITGNVLTAVRGQDGTTGQAFGDSSRIDLRLTAITLSDALADNILPADIKAIYESNAQTNEFSDQEQTDLAEAVLGSDFSNSSFRFKSTIGVMSNVALSTYEVPLRNSAEITKVALGTNEILGRLGGVIKAITPTEERTRINVENGATADQTNTEIRDAVEAATNSNTFNDADHTKLNGIVAGAEVNPALIPQAEIEAGAATSERVISAERFKQGVDALGLSQDTVIAFAVALG